MAEQAPASSDEEAGLRAERLGLLALESLYRGRAVPIGGGALALRADGAPSTPMLNRIVRLGLDEPATEEQLDAGVAALAGTRFYVTLSSGARPAELTGWLRARGFEPGWGWRQFRRSTERAPRVASDLDLVEIGPERGADFAQVLCSAYGLPRAAEAWVAPTPGLAGWTCWLALAEGRPAAAAALFVAGGAGYLGLAGTLPEQRGRGAQSLLLAARIRRAGELGCEEVFAETGDRRADRPSSSYRNLLRAGFEELHVVPNWLGPPPVTAR